MDISKWLCCSSCFQIRLHIIAMHELCEYTKGEGFSEGFDAHLNIEQMNKASAELFQLYDDHRKKGISVPSEKEFRGYYALLKLDRHPGYKVFFHLTQLLLLMGVVCHKLETVIVCSTNGHPVPCQIACREIRNDICHFWLCRKYIRGDAVINLEYDNWKIYILI